MFLFARFEPIVILFGFDLICWIVLLLSLYLFYMDFVSSHLLEPAEDWTIEEFMHHSLLKSQTVLDQRNNALLEALQQQFEQGKTDLLNCQEMIENPTTQENTTTTGTTKPQHLVLPKLKCIHISISTGPHATEVKALVPTDKSPCWVGRSGSKKFREKGISLRKDLEVSTTHGKFEILEGKPYFTDTGSSNGTLIEGREIAPNEPYELKEGMRITLGSSLCTVGLEMV